MADTTYYVNPGSDTSGGWGAGNDSNTETQAKDKATPWRLLEHAIDAQLVASGETCTIIIKNGETLIDTFVRFQTAATHSGRDFIFRSETSGTKFSLNNGGSQYFILSDVTTGSITLTDAISSGGTTRANLFNVSAAKGMDIIINDCNLDYTGAVSSKLYVGLAGSVGDVTLNNVTAITGNAVIQGVGGMLTIDDDCDLTTLINGTAAAILMNLDLDGVDIGAATITALGGGLSRGVYLSPGAVCPTFKIAGATIHSDGFGAFAQSDVDNVQITNCNITSDALTAVIIGNSEDNSVAVTINNVVISNNTIVAEATDARGLMLQTGVKNYDIHFNRIIGDSHSLFTTGDNGHISHNVVNALTTIAMGMFGNNVSIHNNTAYTVSGTAGIVAAPGIAAPQPVQATASINLKIYNNIFVSGDSFGYSDYDESTGLDGGRGVTDAMNDYQDYNCYWRETNTANGSIELGEVGSRQASTTIEELNTAWKSAVASGYVDGDISTYWNVNFGGTNDLNSLIVDPQLDSDFRPHHPDVIKAGMGAVPATTGGGYRSRYGG